MSDLIQLLYAMTTLIVVWRCLPTTGSRDGSGRGGGRSCRIR